MAHIFTCHEVVTLTSFLDGVCVFLGSYLHHKLLGDFQLKNARRSPDFFFFLYDENMTCLENVFVCLFVLTYRIK